MVHVKLLLDVKRFKSVVRQHNSAFGCSWEVEGTTRYSYKVVVSAVPVSGGSLLALPDEVLRLCVETLCCNSMAWVQHSHRYDRFGRSKMTYLCMLGCLELTCKKFEELVILSQLSLRMHMRELELELEQLYQLKTAEGHRQQRLVQDRIEGLEYLLLRRRLKLPRQRPRQLGSVRALRKAEVSELHVVAYRGRADLVAPLVEAGADIENARCRHGTPLMVAILAGHVGVVAALLGAGAQADDSKNDHYQFAGDMPLTMAVKSGRSDMVEALLDGGATVDWLLVNVPPYGLVKVCDDELWFGDYHRPGCRRGGRDNGAEEHWSTPLHDACLRGHLAMVAAFLQAGADVDEIADPDESARDRTPYQVAHEAGHHDIVQLLVENDADCEPYPDPVRVRARLFPITSCRYHCTCEQKGRNPPECGLVRVNMDLFCLAGRPDDDYASDFACYPSDDD